MKKYNMSKIMRRAWELVKTVGTTISEGLKKAWKEAKEMVEIKLEGSEKQVKWAKDIISDVLGTIEANIKRCNKYGYETKEWYEIKSQVEEAISKVTHASQLINARKTFSGKYICYIHDELVMRNKRNVG